SVLGTLTDGGSLVVNNIGGTLLTGDSFNLFDGTITGTFASVLLPTLDAGLTWDQSNLYTTGIITVVPEPATTALLGSGVLLTIWQLRRRRS
ncbi:MAG TPA: PEP-CTERM sorting domain-containing protein, partial [Verrucomicrobiae bacterium]